MCVGRRQLNRVGDEGACALAEALLINSRLQRLGVSANRLSSQVQTLQLSSGQRGLEVHDASATI